MQFNLKLACFPGLLPVPNFYLESLSSFKDRLVSDFFFSVWLEYSKMPTNNPEHCLFRWIVLRVVIWHLFLEI